MKRILIVDDKQEIRLLFRQRLEAAGYQVVEAESGEMALDLVSAEAPDLILLDMLMPGLHGMDLYCQLGEDAQTASIPVVIVTALVEEAFDAAGLKEWAQQEHNFQLRLRPGTVVFSKSIDFKEILAEVDQRLAA